LPSILAGSGLIDVWALTTDGMTARQVPKAAIK